MRQVPDSQIGASADGLAHEYMHNRGGLRRPGRGLIEKDQNPNAVKPQLTFSRLAHRNPDTPPNDIRSDSGIKRTTRLWYYLAPEPMALGIRPRDYVITMASAEGKPPVLKGRSYLIGDSDGYSISTCTEIGNERAVFKREDGDQRASIIPVKDNEPVFDDQIVHHFGVLMSILRGHNEIRSSSAVLQA